MQRHLGSFATSSPSPTLLATMGFASKAGEKSGQDVAEGLARFCPIVVSRSGKKESPLCTTILQNCVFLTRFLGCFRTGREVLYTFPQVLTFPGRREDEERGANVQHRTFNIELPTEEKESEDRSMPLGMSDIRILGEEGKIRWASLSQLRRSMLNVRCSMFKGSEISGFAPSP